MGIFTAMTSAYSLEEAFGAKDITSIAMRGAIAEWVRLYYDRQKTEESDPCQSIAYTVVNKLTKACFGEYSATCDDKYTQGVIDALNVRKREAMQLLMVGGEGFIKPIPTHKGFTFSVIRRDNVLVFGRNAAGEPVDIGTTERTAHGTSFYTLLERRTVDDAGRLTIRNTLYCSESVGHLGHPVPLGTLPQYAELPDEYTFTEPLGGLGLVHMQMPIENTVDGSEDGVSVYAAAVGLIHNIDRNEAQINGEFERGKSRVFVSADLMKRGEDGKRRFDDTVFSALDDSPETVGVTIFSPELREQSYLNRKREYLRNVESIIGIKRGLLSEVEAAERTATEVTSSEGDYNLTIIDLQEVWTQAVKDAVKLCGILGRLYHVPGATEIDPDDVTIDWGDGVLYNREKVGQEMLQQVQSGLLAPERYLAWYYELPCDTPADRQKIREEYMPDMQQLTAGEE